MLVKHIEEWVKLCYEFVKNCKMCDLHKHCLKNVPGHGNLGSKVMLVGEAPGAQEDLLGIPFVGRAGKRLDEIIENAHMKREDFYVTNTIKCRPPYNVTPTRDQISQCVIHLISEITILDPSLIVTMGGTATDTVLKAMGKIRDRAVLSGITKARRKTYVVPSNRVRKPTVIYPTFHPSYTLRNPKTLIPTEADFEYIKTFIDRDMIISELGRTITWLCP